MPFTCGQFFLWCGNSKRGQFQEDQEINHQYNALLMHWYLFNIPLEQCVASFQGNDLYSDDYCKAFQCDLTKADLAENVPLESVDFCSLIFVLSAILPEKMVLALQNIHKVSLTQPSVSNFKFCLHNSSGVGCNDSRKYHAVT